MNDKMYVFKGPQATAFKAYKDFPQWAKKRNIPYPKEHTHTIISQDKEKFAENCKNLQRAGFLILCDWKVALLFNNIPKVIKFCDKSEYNNWHACKEMYILSRIYEEYGEAAAQSYYNNHHFKQLTAFPAQLDLLSKIFKEETQDEKNL